MYVKDLFCRVHGFFVCIFFVFVFWEELLDYACEDDIPSVGYAV